MALIPIKIRKTLHSGEVGEEEVYINPATVTLVKNHDTHPFIVQVTAAGKVFAMNGKLEDVVKELTK